MGISDFQGVIRLLFEGAEGCSWLCHLALALWHLALEQIYYFISLTVAAPAVDNVVHRASVLRSVCCLCWFDILWGLELVGFREFKAVCKLVFCDTSVRVGLRV